MTMVGVKSSENLLMDSPQLGGVRSDDSMSSENTSNRHSEWPDRPRMYNIHHALPL